MTNHDALRVSLGVYAIGKSDDQESRAIRAHVDHCAACRCELTEIMEVVDLLRQAGGLVIGGGPSGVAAGS